MLFDLYMRFHAEQFTLLQAGVPLFGYVPTGTFIQAKIGTNFYQVWGKNSELTKKLMSKFL